jgi:PTH1 family peptidyl-tRNA hydrolase
MKILAGLGNPGKEYESTPHSIGFDVADAVAREMAATFRKSTAFKCELADGRFANGRLMVIKPMTFMNLSGNSVAPAVKYHNAVASDLVVVSDDIDLPVGRIRIRKGGSAGGHNGLKSVIERLGTQDFIRLRIGVGRDRNDRSKVVGHVLGKFDRDTRALMDGQIIPAAVRAAAQIFSEGPDAAMNTWNGWSADSAAGQ